MNSPRPAIVTASLGLPGIYGICQRLAEAARHGFMGVKIIDDIDSYAVQLPGGVAVDENRLTAAAIIKRACDNLGLTVIVFQPFRFYEGLLDRDSQAKMITKLKLWLRIVQVLGTTMIQIPIN
jgi:sugar phosphate isomerase/epimerase